MLFLSNSWRWNWHWSFWCRSWWPFHLVDSRISKEMDNFGGRNTIMSSHDSKILRLHFTMILLTQRSRSSVTRILSVSDPPSSTRHKYKKFIIIMTSYIIYNCWMICGHRTTRSQTINSAGSSFTWKTIQRMMNPASRVKTCFCLANFLAVSIKVKTENQGSLFP